ncbi:hypothetical protein V5O48_008965 [Marasmius crinis-equi]|uniref:F-box domain-containing protein n=1 Tax=Marasmius crinis-equi TaxID=585013 RepID=A0ABR3FD36_9AGAR
MQTVSENKIRILSNILLHCQQQEQGRLRSFIALTQVNREFFTNGTLAIQEVLEIGNPRDLRRYVDRVRRARETKWGDGSCLDELDAETMRDAVRDVTLGERWGSRYDADSFGNRFDPRKVIDFLSSHKNLQSLSIFRTTFPVSQLFDILSQLPELKRVQVKWFKERNDIFFRYNESDVPVILPDIETVYLAELGKPWVHQHGVLEATAGLMTTPSVAHLHLEWETFHDVFHDIWPGIQRGTLEYERPESLQSFTLGKSSGRSLQPGSSMANRVGGYIMLFLEHAAEDLQELSLQCDFELKIPDVYSTLPFPELKSFSGPVPLLIRLRIGRHLREVELLGPITMVSQFYRMPWRRCLRVLRMRYYDYEGFDAEPYAQIANACPGVTHIFFATSGCSLGASGMRRLWTVISQFPNLEVLELRGAYPFNPPFFGDGYQSIFVPEEDPATVVPELFSTHPSLRVLSVQSTLKWVRGASGWEMYEITDKNSRITTSDDLEDM